MDKLKPDIGCKAEIRWAIHMVENNYSFHSSNHCSTTFSSMFSDSLSASKVTLDEKKLPYLINYGVCFQVRQMILHELADQPYFLQVGEVTSTNDHFYMIVVHIHKTVQ